MDRKKYILFSQFILLGINRLCATEMAPRLAHLHYYDINNRIYNFWYSSRNNLSKLSYFFLNYSFCVWCALSNYTQSLTRDQIEADRFCRKNNYVANKCFRCAAKRKKTPKFWIKKQPHSPLPLQVKWMFPNKLLKVPKNTRNLLKYWYMYNYAETTGGNQSLNNSQILVHVYAETKEVNNWQLSVYRFSVY